MKLDRRALLKIGTAGFGVAVISIPTGASAAGRLTGVTYLPPSYKALSYGSNGFVERLKEAVPEGTTVDFYDSGKLLKADEQLPALRSGTIDFMFHTTSYITRSLPILGITGLPGIVEDLYENPERLAYGSPLFDLMNEHLQGDDLVMLSMGGNILEPEYIWSTGKAPIKSIADIKGKKIRVVSYEATKVIENFGGAAVRIPSSELYLALQRGTVDAAVMNISTCIGRSLQEQVSQVYKLPLTGYGIAIFVEKNRWASMDEGVKTAMQETAKWFDAESAKVPNEDIYPNEYWPTVKEAGVEITDASKEDAEELAEAAEGVIEEWKGEVGEEVAERALALARGESEG